MDQVIKEGTLRLHTTESTCDIILSCNGERLMAHKLILCIASPIFRDILSKNPDATIVILPEIDGSTMSLVLDYIYTGTTVVYSKNIQDFISLAKFLQIDLNEKYLNSLLEGKNYNFDDVEVEKKEDVNFSKDLANNNVLPNMTDIFARDTKNDDKDFIKNINSQNYTECFKLNEPQILSKKSLLPNAKTRKKLPSLLPLLNSPKPTRTPQSKLSNLVIPSPWSPRFGEIFMEDPRKMYLKAAESGVPVCNSINCSQEDDNNNNPILTAYPHQTSPCYVPRKLDNAIRNLYLNNNGSKNKTKSTSSSFFEKNCFQKTKEKTLGTKTENRAITNFLATREQKIPSSDLALNLSETLSIKNFQSTCEQNSREITSTSDVNVRSNDKKCQVEVKTCILNKTVFDTNDLPINLTRDHGEYEKNKNIIVTQIPVKTNSISNCALSDNQDSCELDSSLDSSDASDSIISVNDIDLVNIKKFGKEAAISYVHQKESQKKKGRKNEAKDEKKKSFQCVDCQKSFSQLRNYKYHRSLHEGTKEFSAKCFECGKTFNDRGYLSSHMKIHRDKKEYACQHCPKRFNQRVAYNMHLRIHTGLKPHQCPTCEKSFSRKMLLKQHQRVHTGERPYSCPECGKSFADRSNMSLHARLHTGVKPYACDLCPKSFTKKHHLKTHMNFHTGLKPYSCENCGLAFSQSSNMRTHYKKCILKKDGKDPESNKCEPVEEKTV